MSSEAREAFFNTARECLQTVESIHKFYAAKNFRVDLEKLEALLNIILSWNRGTAVATPDVQAEKTDIAIKASTTSAVATAGEARTRTREAAWASLEELIRYFRRTEPSSPIPYMLQRAQRCIGKDYLELISELGQDRSSIDQILKPEPKPGTP